MSLDVETTNLEKGSALNARNRLLLAVCILGPDHPSRGRLGRVVRLWNGEHDSGELVRLVEECGFLVAHNAKFELQWLRRCGVDLRSVVTFCTQIGQYCINGNRRRPLSLDALTGGGKKRYVHWLIENGVCPSEIAPSALAEYCQEDTELCEKLFLDQRVKMQELGLLPVVYQRNLVTPALADIEFSGVKADHERVKSTHTSVLGDYQDAVSRLEQITGAVNWNSTKQVSDVLYGSLQFSELVDKRGNPLRTGKGGKRTDATTIASLYAETPEQRAFKRAYAKLAPLKKQVQILEKLVKACEEDNGLIYARFNQTVTQTHRLSSTGGKWKFQFHNFPRAFKSLFTCRKPGWSIAEADAPQLEFRAAVFLGNDSKGKQLIETGGDVHALSARIIGVDRQEAKKHTFKPLYGGESGTKKEQAYYEAFRKEYPDIYRTQESWVQQVVANKQLRIPSGLIFYWPEAKLVRYGKSLRLNVRANVFNYPVQSFATADIIPLTLVLLWHMLKGMQSFICNTIHDSVISEVHPDEVEEYKAIVELAFTGDILYAILQDLYGITFDVPLGADLKIGQYWGEGTKFTYKARIT